jgi:hypothetical protein
MTLEHGNARKQVTIRGQVVVVPSTLAFFIWALEKHPAIRWCRIQRFIRAKS